MYYEMHERPASTRRHVRGAGPRGRAAARQQEREPGVFHDVEDVGEGHAREVVPEVGAIGLRLTQFPQILKTYDITAARMQQEAMGRGCRIATISFNGPTHDAARRAEVVASAKTAMNFLKEFGAAHLVVFSPNRSMRAKPRSAPCANARF